MIKEKNIIAKIFEVERHQVLVSRFNDHVDPKFSIKIETCINDKSIFMEKDFIEINERDEIFEFYDIIEALEFFNRASKSLEL